MSNEPSADNPLIGDIEAFLKNNRLSGALTAHSELETSSGISTFEVNSGKLVAYDPHGLGDKRGLYVDEPGVDNALKELRRKTSAMKPTVPLASGLFASLGGDASLDIYRNGDAIEIVEGGVAQKDLKDGIDHGELLYQIDSGAATLLIGDKGSLGVKDSFTVTDRYQREIPLPHVALGNGRYRCEVKREEGGISHVASIRITKIPG